MFRALAVLAALQSLNTVINAEECISSWLSPTCVNPDAQASAQFTFPPLFTSASPAKFVYAIDDVASKDIPKGYTKSANAAFWVEYNKVDLNSSTKAMNTELAVLFTKNGKQPSGGENGCLGLLGAECVQGLKETLRKTTLANNAKGGWQPLTSMLPVLASLSVCPIEVLSDSMIILEPVANDYGYASKLTFAYEDPAPVNETTILKGPRVKPSGSSIHPYAVNSYFEQSLDDLASKAAIAILFRSPDSLFSSSVTINESTDIQTTLVCVKVSSKSSPVTPEGSPGKGDPGKGVPAKGAPSSASSYRVGSLLVAPIVVLMYWVALGTF